MTATAAAAAAEHRRIAGRRGVMRRMRRWATTTPTTSQRATDILCAFRIVPQDGRRRRSRRRRPWRASRRTATWTVVWTDRLTAHEHYQAKCYRVDPVPGSEVSTIAYIAYDLDLFEEGSIANLTSSIIGNVFGFKALKALRLEDMRIPPHYVKTFQGPAHRHCDGARVPQQVWPPAAGGHDQAQAGALGAQLWPRGVRGAVRRAGFHQRRREHQQRSRLCAGATASCSVWRRSTRPCANTGEIKGHYLNVTAGTMEEMYERAEFAKELGSVIIMIDLTVGYTAIQSMAEVGAQKWRDPAPAPRWPRHLHAPEDPWCELSGDQQVDAPGWRRPHPRRHGGGQARGRPERRCRATTPPCARDKIDPRTRSRASTSSRTGPRCRR